MRIVAERVSVHSRCRSATKHKKKADLTAQIGRRGSEATVVFMNRKGGPMEDRRTRRNRSRSDQRRRALSEAQG